MQGWLRAELSLYSCCLVAQLCLNLCDPMDCSMPGFSTLHHLLEPAQTHVHCVDNAIQPSHPLSSPSLPALNLPQHQGFFQWVALCIGGQSIGASASASVLLVNIQGWFPLGLTGLIGLAVQGTHKSLLQHHSLKASVLGHSAFFMVQLSNPYITTGKTITLTI